MKKATCYLRTEEVLGQIHPNPKHFKISYVEQFPSSMESGGQKEQSCVLGRLKPVGIHLQFFTDVQSEHPSVSTDAP